MIDDKDDDKQKGWNSSLKAGKPLSRKTALKTKTQLKAKKPWESKSTFKQTGFKKQDPLKAKKKKTSRGLKGHGRTKTDKQLHGDIVDLSCIACLKIGCDPISRLTVHHPKGRNKGKSGDYSEKWVICLCDQHHGSPGAPKEASECSVHKNKKAFVELIGTEAWCVHETYRLLNDKPVWLTADEWEFYLDLPDQESQEEWLVMLLQQLRETGPTTEPEGSSDV